MIFKVFGFLRSGTTYMRELLHTNFGATVLTNELGWKHGHVSEPSAQLKKERHKHSPEMITFLKERIEKKDIDAVIMVKNPHSWLPSIKRWAEKNPKWEAFNAREAILNWNLRYSHYLSVKAPLWCYRSFVIVRYEDVLMDLKREMRRVSASCGEAPKTFLNVSKVPQSDTFTAERRKFYLNPPQEAAVLAYCDRVLMKKLGYL